MQALFTGIAKPLSKAMPVRNAILDIVMKTVKA